MTLGMRWRYFFRRPRNWNPRLRNGQPSRRVGKYGLRACPLFPINAFKEGLNYETCVK